MQFSVVISRPKIELCLKIIYHDLLSKIPALLNSYNNILIDFELVVFHTQNTIFVIHNI